jgi:hypothetical protein
MSYKEKEELAKARRNTCWRCKKDKKKVFCFALIPSISKVVPDITV